MKKIEDVDYKEVKESKPRRVNPVLLTFFLYGLMLIGFIFYKKYEGLIPFALLIPALSVGMQVWLWQSQKDDEDFWNNRRRAR